MKKAIVALFLTIGYLTFSKAQTNLNDYKYVIVQKQFHFQKEPNEYNLNELTRFLFRKYGFRPILYSEVYPDDLKSDLCLALTSEIISKGTFKTKITITLRNCNNNIVFQVEGNTKEKYFDKVYNIGIRNAMEGFKDVNYNYIEKQKTVNQEKPPNTEEKAKDSNLIVEELNTEIEQPKEKEGNIAVKEEIQEEKPFINTEKITIVKKIKNYYNVKSITNGFELISSKSNKIEYIIHKTGMDNVYILKGNNGIIYKKGNQWIREYIEDYKTVIDFLDIRF